MITSATIAKLHRQRVKKEKDDGPCGSSMAYVADDSVICRARFSWYCDATRYVAGKQFGSGRNPADESDRKRPARFYRAAGRDGWRDLRTGPSHQRRDAASGDAATAGCAR